MAALERFLEMLAAEKGVARSTLSAYETDLKDFFHFLKGKDPNQVSHQEIQNYLQTQKHLASSSLARRLSALRQFYKYLISEENLIENPTTIIESPRYRRKLPSVLSEEDVTRLLEGARSWQGEEGIRLSALLEILYASGFRVSELVSLSFAAAVEVLKSDKPFLMVRGKGNKDRLVPLTSAALEALQKYLKIRASFLKKGKESPWLFPSSSREGHLTRQRFGQLLKELAAKVGMNPQILSPHTLRHAFATHLLRHGADLMIVQKLLGHSDISTTQIYTHVAQDDLAEMVKTYHPLGKGFT
ncbi:MAG: tyrosine recombinase XerD [uncultured bacterium]|nr:MAG: tyrosine recombinase XerD [uncultured bacterium]OFW69585.1 MAG: site-specific tyrosine recombinase XerD [Alphaproteobacteria bacterium GWC2_42_16]OFW74109.1 MAG: site-specific tyrosine recombinase XerD [Alphaproteobacteria bacterium GWA2_41_27]OFW84417.1 MAG: site-specific tyrosine recombinase XerD [Alphaproteobacteria bacterium RIFCSPHIGHO2_12_FULL_42_100]OFW85938.1 MAG: site-specific tyrosine recombinase XerD [Alphaproteobacteria bacterium RBG_16_42_14]OFW92264.1 MAG: site-specific t